MNSFYANLEYLRHPELHGTPLAVASHVHARGSVLAASYSAKRLGVRTGMKVADAQQLCPNLRVFQGDLTYYRACHSALMQALKPFVPSEAFWVRSIDEAAMFLGPLQQQSATRHSLALQIKAAISQALGPTVTASVGIGPNVFLAKLGTELQKPDGLVDVTLANLLSHLDTLELTDLPGIAHANAARLATINITTPRQFAEASAEVLRHHFGIWGQQWWWRLHGYECDDPPREQQTLSHEHVLKRWISTHAEIRPILSNMIEHLLHRLSKNHMSCRGIWLHFSHNGAPAFHAERHFDAPTTSFPELLNGLIALTASYRPSSDTPIRKISIGMWGLETRQHTVQPDLFTRDTLGDRLSQSLLSIRMRHGYRIIQTGATLLPNPEHLVKQPGFGQIRDRVGY
jgi:DNA polymerase-4